MESSSQMHYTTSWCAVGFFSLCRCFSNGVWQVAKRGQKNFWEIPQKSLLYHLRSVRGGQVWMKKTKAHQRASLRVALKATLQYIVEFQSNFFVYWRWRWKKSIFFPSIRVRKKSIYLWNHGKGNESSYEVLLHGKLTFLMGQSCSASFCSSKASYHGLQATLTKTPTFITDDAFWALHVLSEKWLKISFTHTKKNLRSGGDVTS